MNIYPASGAGGLRVVNTREGRLRAELLDRLPSDALVLDVPLTTTRWSSVAQVRAQLATLAPPEPYAAFVVSSARAGDYLELVRDSLSHGVQVYAVGRVTEKLLIERGFTVAYCSEDGAQGLVGHVVAGPVLMLGALEMQPELPTALRERGIRVDQVHCYATAPRTLTAHEVDVIRGADALFIGAPSAWRVAAPYVDPATVVIVPGNSTGRAVRETHARVHVGWDDSLADLWPTVAPRP